MLASRLRSSEVRTSLANNRRPPAFSSSQAVRIRGHDVAEICHTSPIMSGRFRPSLAIRPRCSVLRLARCLPPMPTCGSTCDFAYLGKISDRRPMVVACDRPQVWSQGFVGRFGPSRPHEAHGSRAALALQAPIPAGNIGYGCPGPVGPALAQRARDRQDQRSPTRPGAPSTTPHLQLNGGQVGPPRRTTASLDLRLVFRVPSDPRLLPLGGVPDASPHSCTDAPRPGIPLRCRGTPYTIGQMRAGAPAVRTAILVGCARRRVWAIEGHMAGSADVFNAARVQGYSEQQGMFI